MNASAQVLPKTADKKLIFGRALRSLITIGLLTTIVAGCMVQSPEPQVEDIVKVAAPTFSGQAEAFISSPSQAYTLSGECDPAAASTEYSTDQTNWTAVTCSQGKFTVSVVLAGYADVWARSNGKFTQTPTSHARVRFLLPPTSDSVIAGSSSKSSNSDLIGPGTQNIMAATFEGNVPQNGSFKIQTMLPRIVYGP